MCQALCKVGHLMVDNISLILKMRHWPPTTCWQMVKAGLRLDALGWHVRHALSMCAHSSFNTPFVSLLGCALANTLSSPLLRYHFSTD